MNNRRRSPTRRSVAGATLAGIISGCTTRAAPDGSARLLARPGKPEAQAAPGVHPLGLRGNRDSLLYVPKSINRDRPGALLVYLHGAGGSEQQGIERMSALADDFGFLLLSPASRGGTWDAIQDGYGPDVRAIDEALTRTFAASNVDPLRIAVSGFSDGASYALGLGLSNGDVLHHVLAFSPGFIPFSGNWVGRPRVFVSHGTKDAVLPIAKCSRRLVPQMMERGYEVKYREFNGPHTVPPEIAQEAMRWFLA